MPTFKRFGVMVYSAGSSLSGCAFSSYPVLDAYWYYSDTAWKPIFQKLTSGPDDGVACKELRDRSCDCPWHVHEEHELILVLAGGGYWMVGDHLAARRAGDLLLVGPNLPHVFRSDEHRPGRVLPTRALLVQFKADFLGREFMEREVLAPVQRLLRRSSLGLAFGGMVRDEVAGLMQELLRLQGLRRLIHFLRILEVLARAREVKALATPGFAGEGNPFDQERMNRVCRFIEERLGETIFLASAWAPEGETYSMLWCLRRM
jgi:mannose-6-phosphate isomerase-like protein (cupin superfamily)